MRLLTDKLAPFLFADPKEARRFILVGIGNVIFTYIVYIIVNLFSPYILAYTVSFGSGILFSAYWNSRYSFSTTLTMKRLVVFTLVCLINLFIGMAFIKFLIETLLIHETAAPILVVGVMVPITFVGTRLTLVGSWSANAE